MKQSNKKKIIVGAPNCIPWQKCPVCNGTKQVLRNHYVPMGTDSVIWRPCDTCNGLGIIPMFVLPTDVCPKCGQFKTTAGNGILRQLCMCG